MNNRIDRLKYLEDTFGCTKPNMCEEFVVSSIARNDYAIKFVEKEMSKVGYRYDYNYEFGSTANILDYNMAAIYKKSYDKIPEVNLVLFYMTYAESNNNIGLIEKLMKKSFSKEFKLVSADFNGEFYLKEKGLNLMAVAFICSLLGKNIENERYGHIRYTLIEEIGVVNEIFLLLNIDINGPQAKVLEEKYESLIKGFNLKKEYCISSLEDKILSEQFDIYIEEMRKQGFDEKEAAMELALTIDDKNGIYSRLFNNNALTRNEYRQLACMQDIVTSFTRDYEVFSKIKLNFQDTLNILSLMDSLEEHKTSKDIKSDFISSLYLYVLMKDSENKGTVITALSIEKDALLADFRKEHLESLKDLDIYKSKTRMLEDELRVSNMEIDSLKKEKANLAAKINALSDKLEKEEINKTELTALRNLFFELDNCIVEDSLNVVEVDEVLADKVAFVAGHDKLQTKIKEIYPNFIFVGVDDNNRDLTYLKNMEHVFIHTYISHSLYYKVVNVLISNNIPFTFLNVSNVEILKSQINAKLLEKCK